MSSFKVFMTSELEAFAEKRTDFLMRQVEVAELLEVDLRI